ncbi:hypothetical protein BKA70DRAFT_1565099 [Coprinopsis sp. MPI-PUGE-AT-0042]|nr:hypothetical protein BKA70DRAFT_1565099 [Coprinopsis sp. MPI-PUGE-AT-0042]
MAGRTHRSAMRKRLHSSILYSFRYDKDIPIPLFPNVIHISLPCLNELPLESIFYSAATLSRSLRSVTLIANDFMVDAGPRGIQPKGETDQWDGMRRRLSPFLPSLRSFSIEGPEFEEVYALLSRRQVDELVLQLSTPLTNIDISSVSICHSTLLALSSLPQLAKLSLSIGLQPGQITEAHKGKPLAFPTLVDIHINIMDEERGNIFLGQLCAPSLGTCTMSFKPPDRSLRPSHLKAF